jgi:hypothetical protein
MADEAATVPQPQKRQLVNESRDIRRLGDCPRPGGGLRPVRPRLRGASLARTFRASPQHLGGWRLSGQFAIFPQYRHCFLLCYRYPLSLPSPHLTAPHLTSPHLTSPHLTSPSCFSPLPATHHLTSSLLAALYLPPSLPYHSHSLTLSLSPRSFSYFLLDDALAPLCSPPKADRSRFFFNTTLLTLANPHFFPSISLDTFAFQLCTAALYPLARIPGRVFFFLHLLASTLSYHTRLLLVSFLLKFTTIEYLNLPMPKHPTILYSSSA